MTEATQQGDVEQLTFEQAQAELEQIVERLEDPHTGLDDAISLWERGEALHAFCQRKLDYAAQRLEKLQVTADEAAAVVAEGGDDFAHGNGAGTLPAEPADAAPADSADAARVEGEAPLF